MEAALARMEARSAALREENERTQQKLEELSIALEAATRHPAPGCGAVFHWCGNAPSVTFPHFWSFVTFGNFVVFGQFLSLLVTGAAGLLRSRTSPF
eukprot:7170546-Pyramimonas_sp.AAC.1